MTDHHTDAEHGYSVDNDPPLEPEIPTCSICRRRRTIGTPDHPMDAYDYSPAQPLTGQPVGWYSGDDGEVCPEDMTKMLANQ